MSIENSKSAIIFGGSRGIGRAIANSFVRDGFKVSIVARTKEHLKESVKSLSSISNVSGIMADISIFREVENVVATHLKAYKRIDTVINAAAIQEPIDMIWDSDPVKWEKTISTNLVGSYNILRVVVPVMYERKKGTVIMFSGGGAAYARPHFSAYGCSKTAILRLVETADAEMKESSGDILFYAIAPGAVLTGMTEEVMKNPSSSGKKAYQEALSTKLKGGTPPLKAAELCLFLANKRPACLSGRLIHVNEPYREFALRFAGKNIEDSGLLRRQPYPSATE